jgi:hypothetical protein
MPKGSNPGEHRGGRAAGTPNKFGIVRAERLIAEGKKPPAEELLSNAEKCRAMAVFFAPTRPNADGKEEPNPDHIEERYGYWLAQERDALARAAPYFSPRLSAIAMQTAVLDKDKEIRGDPRVALLNLILEMRARDPGRQRALPAPKGNGHGEIIDAVVEQVVEEDEDNGDGEVV